MKWQAVTAVLWLCFCIETVCSMDPFLRDLLNSHINVCNYIPLCTMRAQNMTKPPGMYFYGTEQFCCNPCSCEDDCWNKGNCCPDKISNESWNPENEDLTREQVTFECRYPTVKGPNENRILSRSYYTVTSCPASLNNMSLAYQRCHQIRRNFLEDLKPFYSKKSRRIYANRFCSICNQEQESDLVPWEPKLLCNFLGNFGPYSTDLVTNSNSLTRHELIAQITKTISNDDFGSCNVIFEPPEGISAASEECIEDTFLYDKCISEDLMTADNLSVAEACYTFTLPYGMIMGSMSRRIFKNVFCFLCNFYAHKDVVPVPVASELCRPQIFQAPVISFSAILNYNQQSQQQAESPCNATEVFDPYKNVCRNLICTPFSVPPLCQPIFKTPMSASYDIHIAVTPSSGFITLQEAHDLTDELASEVWNDLVKASHMIKPCSIEVWYRTRADYDTDDSNNTLVDSFLLFVSFYAPSVKLTDLYELLSVSVPDISPLKIRGYIFSLFLDNRLYQIRRRGMFILDIHYREYIYTSKFFSVGDICVVGVGVTKFTICPQIELGPGEYRVSSDNSSITLGWAKDLVLGDNDYYFKFHNPNDGTGVRVCLADFLKVSTLTSAERSRSHGYIRHVLLSVSLICTACLLLYDIQGQRRKDSFAGKRIVLSVNISVVLIFSQLLKDAMPKLDCSVLAVFEHFLWLNIPLWIAYNAYSCHKTFKAKINAEQTGNHGKREKLFSALLLCNCSSGLLVAATIISSLMLSNKESIGYDKTFCIISRTDLMVGTFLLPVSISLLALFCLLGMALKLVSANWGHISGDIKEVMKRLIELSLLAVYLTVLEGSLFTVAFLPRRDTLFVSQVLVACSGIVLLAFRLVMYTLKYE